MYMINRLNSQKSFKIFMLKFNGWQKLEHIFKKMCKLPPFIHFRSIDTSFYFLKKCRSIASNNGLLFLITLLKNSKVALSRHLCKTPLTSSDGRVSLDHFGLPRILPWYLRKLIYQRDKNSIILAFTLLSVSRIIPVRGRPKYLSIIEQFNGNIDTVNICKTYIKEKFGPYLIELSNYSKIKTIRLSKILPSVKVGPSGAPAALSITLEAILMKKSNLYNYFLEFIMLSGNSRLLEWFNHYSNGISIPKNRIFDKILSKLIELPDKEGKVRLIAILDGWTQACFKPLHEFCFSLMFKMSCDYTYNQRNALPELKSKFDQMILQGLEPVYHCYDLTAATDRLPILVQSYIVNELYGYPLIGDAWVNLISNRTFLTRNGKSIKYEVGQPMGAYSSFALLSLTHHMIVQLAAYQCGIPLYNNYSIVGDDIVILDKDVAKKYLILMQGLGLVINPIKSYISTDFMEFCKRYWYKGIDVSPFPIALLQNEDSANHADFHREIVLRGYEELRTSIVDFNQQMWLTSPNSGTSVSDILKWMDLYGPSWLQSSCNHTTEDELNSPYFKFYLLSVVLLLLTDLYGIAIGHKSDYKIDYIVPKKWEWLKQHILIDTKIDLSWLEQHIYLGIDENAKLRGKVMLYLHLLQKSQSDNTPLSEIYVKEIMELTLIHMNEGSYVSGEVLPTHFGVHSPRLVNFWASCLDSNPNEGSKIDSVKNFFNFLNIK